MVTLCLLMMIEAELKRDFFPQITSKDLNRRKVELPQDFPGKPTIVVLGFDPKQQPLIDTWIEAGRILKETFPTIDFMELPVVERPTAVKRMLVEQALRFGIRDKHIRARLAVLFIERAPFLKRLEIETMEEIVAFLVAGDGSILWRHNGPACEDSSADLKLKVAEYLELAPAGAK